MLDWSQGVSEIFFSSRRWVDCTHFAEERTEGDLFSTSCWVSLLDSRVHVLPIALKSIAPMFQAWPIVFFQRLNSHQSRYVWNNQTKPSLKVEHLGLDMRKSGRVLPSCLKSWTLVPQKSTKQGSKQIKQNISGKNNLDVHGTNKNSNDHHSFSHLFIWAPVHANTYIPLTIHLNS